MFFNEFSKGNRKLPQPKCVQETYHIPHLTYDYCPLEESSRREAYMCKLDPSSLSPLDLKIHLMRHVVYMLKGISCTDQGI